MNKNNKKLLTKFCEMIVNKRIIFFVLVVFACFMINKTVVVNDITTFLPKDSETRQSIDIMNKQFKETNMFNIMFKDVTVSRANELKTKIGQVQGVSAVSFDENSSYKDSCAFMTIILNTDADTAVTSQSIQNTLDGQKFYSTSLLKDETTSFAGEMTLILLISVFVIIVVLLLTSKSFLEIPVFLIVFIVAGLLNMGTNFIFPSVSFVTNSIAVVLQLALAVDYAIIFAHRYIDERKSFDNKTAVVNALGKAMKEVLSSSLTTVSGLIALMLMTLQIGTDLGLVLSKGIIFSCLTVFLLMPGLLMVFGKAIDKTMHRSFIPSIAKPAKAMLKARYVVSSVFLCLVILAGFIQSANTYSYEYSSKEAITSQQEIESVFGKSESIGILLSNESYDKEYEIIQMLKENPNVKSVTGFSSIEIMGKRITQKITANEAVSLLPTIEKTLIENVFRAYALTQGNLTPNLQTYKVPIVDILEFSLKFAESQDIQLPEEMAAISDLLRQGREMLSNKDYSRIMITLNIERDLQKDFLLIDEISSGVREKSQDALVFGNYAVIRDLSRGFMSDVLLISILTCVFIFIILLLTFKSISLPIILIFAIQGSIFINFSIPAIMSAPVFFMSYIIVSAIQMGATIDYAIIITNRYLGERKTQNDCKTAMANALNSSFPSVMTSGLMLTVAGFLVGTISTQSIVSSIGIFLGQGALISLIVVLFALPQILVLCDKIIQKTTLKSRRKKDEQTAKTANSQDDTQIS